MSKHTAKHYRQTFPCKAEVIAQTRDPAVREMLQRLEAQGIETVFDRFDAQKRHCGFGLDGNCCRICNMGPCKVTPSSPRGVCGADADLIVARNLLRWVAAGVASHGARGREVILTLKAAAEGRVPLEIKGEAKLRSVATALGIAHTAKDTATLAGEVADVLLEDLSRTVPGTHRTLQALAPKERLACWSALDILPIGAYHEVFEALHRTGTGTDGDWQNVMRQLLRCGLAFAWNSVMGTSIAMDILYGEPQRDVISANLGSLDADYINIVIHGHSPVLPMAMVNHADAPAVHEQALACGARGVRFYGVCCSGLSALYRHGGVSPLANAMGAELILGTGAIDLWVADVQDVYPGIMEVAQCFHTQVVTTNDACRLPGAIHLGFDQQHRNLPEIEQIAQQIVALAIAQFPKRQRNQAQIPNIHTEAEIGFSIENLSTAFHGLTPLYHALRDGRIKGIVNLVGCNNPKVLYETTLCVVADALLAENVVILTNGCASFPLLKLGYCTRQALDKTGHALRELLTALQLPPVWHMGECLDNARASGLFRALSEQAGVDLKNMPFAFASPEWSNEKGVGAALGFRLLGIPSYHCVPAPIAGSEAVSRFFYADTQALLGAVMVVETDPQQLAQRIISDLNARRALLPDWMP